MTSQVYHQGKLILSKRPIEEVLQDENIPEDKKQKLKFVNVVLEFAKKNGLDPDGSYLHYVHTEEPVVSYLVYAAYKDRFELKKRWFPFVGSVPYLGYFAKADRDHKAKALKSEGYDVYRTGASAFSLLGWIADPIYAPMLKHSDIDLAHLLFHELTHKTFWAPGKAKFNENLAEFVAMHLTKDFVASQDSQEEYQRYLAKRDDRKLYKEWLKALREELKSFYKDWQGEDLQVLLSERKKIFDRYTSEHGLPKFKTDEFAYLQRKRWNNASILAASIYSPDTEIFDQAHACLKKPQMGVFLQELKGAIKDAKNGIAALKSFCDSAPAQ